MVYGKVRFVYGPLLCTGFGIPSHHLRKMYVLSGEIYPVYQVLLDKGIKHHYNDLV